MEVAAGDTEPALVMQTARLVDTREPARRTARGVISIGLLPPGSYVARAVVSVDNREIGRAVHPFRIPVRPAAASSAAVSPGEALAVPPVDGFSSDAVLDGALVGPYLDRIESEALDHPSGPLKTALADARAGRFAGLAAMTPASAGEQLAASFLRGMGLLAKGDLENAAGQFRAVLKIRSDFFPALVYLGACYAAGGRDREAAAAWQTSLITESDNAAIYRLLADALLRARDADQAVAVLREAVDAWPEDADIGRRLAMALVAANQRGDALSALTVHLDRNPTDVEGLLLAIQLIYQAHAADRPIADRARERELLARYADAYRAANGPQQALVDKWVKFLDEKR
jgi:Flp pilus assembly protein TadD